MNESPSRCAQRSAPSWTSVPARLAVVVGAVALFVAPACGSDESSPRSVPTADASLDRTVISKEAGTGGSLGLDATSHVDGSSTDSATADTGAPNDGSAAEGLPADLVAFCQRYSQTVCDLQIACGFAALPPKAQCVSGENEKCLDSMKAVALAIRAGRITFDASKVDACFTDAKGPFCDTNNFGSGVASCQSVLRGTVPLGGTCYAPYLPVLADGLYLHECDKGYCDATIHSCPGTCLAYAQVGDPCSQVANHCAPATYCDGAHCQNFLKLGDRCDIAGKQCAPTLVCGPTDGVDGGIVCEPQRKEGERCQWDGECHRLYCLTGTCRPGHAGETCAGFLSCEPALKCGANGCQTPISEGGACSANYDACASGLVCDVTGQNDAGDSVGLCHVPKSPTAGQSCFNRTCASGFWCDDNGGGAGTCKAAGAAGATCSVGANGSCSTGFACNGTTKQCQAVSGGGGPCDPDWTVTCQTGLRCSPDHKCVATVGPGEACSFRAQCPLGYDCDGTCKLGKLPGAVCTDKDVCIGGACNTAAGTCNGDCIDPG